MKIESSLDWQDVKYLLIRQSDGLASYTEFYKIIKNIDNEIKLLGNEEIHARITGKDRRVKEMIAKINSSIDIIEQHLILVALSK